MRQPNQATVTLAFPPFAFGVECEGNNANVGRRAPAAECNVGHPGTRQAGVNYEQIEDTDRSIDGPRRVVVGIGVVQPFGADGHLSQ